MDIFFFWSVFFFLLKNFFCSQKKLYPPKKNFHLSKKKFHLSKKISPVKKNLRLKKKLDTTKKINVLAAPLYSDLPCLRILFPYVLKRLYICRHIALLQLIQFLTRCNFGHYYCLLFRYIFLLVWNRTKTFHLGSDCHAI